MSESKEVSGMMAYLHIIVALALVAGWDLLEMLAMVAHLVNKRE